MSGEILPVKLEEKLLAIEDMPKEGAWIPFLVTGMSKLSNVLKQGMFHTRGREIHSMATQTSDRNENNDFSFFI